ncbi:MAG: tetratricopeptide repeat protein, partial [Candidatus Eiseniibacteriota bacterium]
ALAWLPALAFVAWHGRRVLRPDTAGQRPVAWVGLLLPMAALAATARQIATAWVQVDHAHLVPPGVPRGDLLRAAFAGSRPADLMNVIALLSPLAMGAGIAAAASRWRPSSAGGREGLFLLLLAAPWILLLVIVHPMQGHFRDWDVFVVMGAALSLVTAWWGAAVLSSAPAWRWLSAPLALGAMAPSGQWLLHNADLERGFARVEAYLREPPERPPGERARHLEFIGLRANELRQWDRSASALGRAAEIAPRPRILMTWAAAEHMRGNDPLAEAIFRRMVAIAPDDARGWDGLANISWRLGHWAECRRAVLELRRLVPGDPVARRVLERLERGDTLRVQPPAGPGMLP